MKLGALKSLMSHDGTECGTGKQLVTSSISDTAIQVSSPPISSDSSDHSHSDQNGHNTIKQSHLITVDAIGVHQM